MPADHSLHFGPFHLDPVNACVWRGTDVLPLTPKAFAVLHYLVEHPGRLVSKEDLLAAVWPDTVVGDAVLKTCVRELRKVLGDAVKAPQFIETAHRRGYRFIGKVVSSQYSVVSSQREENQKAKGELRFPTSNTQHPVPLLVGRDAELAQLHGWFEKAVRGERQVVFVTGELGIGKTALVETFLSHISAEGDAWLAQGQCFEQYGAGEAYLPVLEAFGRLSQEPGRERLVALLTQYAPTWLTQMPALVSSTDRQRLQQEILGATPERMLREMTEAIEALTAEVPLVLVLEDLHWSDYSTLDLVTALARRRQPARVLVIGTYRPVDVIVSDHPVKRLKQELQGHGQCEEMPLDLLAPAEVATYLATRFPENVLPEELARTIHRRTDGNPLFLINFVEYLVAQGLICQDGNRWELCGGATQVEEGMPEGIRQMIEWQIERVSAEEQRLLEAASVAGMEFAAATVAAVLAEQVGRIEECCDHLCQQHQFLRAGEPRTWPDGTVTASYEFTHSLYQNVLFQRVAVVRRLRFHQRIGERLEMGYGGQAKDIAAELALHFEQGRDYRRAIYYLRHAAEQAAQRYANRGTRQYLTRALGLVGQAPEAEQVSLRLALLEQRGVVSRALGDMQQAAQDFSTLASYAQELGLVEREVQALSELATALSWVDRERCLEAEQRAAMLSQNLTDEDLRTRVRGYAAYWNLLWRGWREEDAHACAAAVEAARRAKDPALLGVQVGRFSFFQCLQSHYADACRGAQEGGRLTQEVGDAHNHLLCRFFLAWALLHHGQWGELLRLLRESMAMAKRNGNRHWALLFSLELAWLYVQLGCFSQARDLCEQGLRQAGEMSLPYGQLVSSVLLGLAYAGLGQHGLAFQYLDEIARRLERGQMLMHWIWRMPLLLGLSEYWLAQREYSRARHEAEQLCELAAQPEERTYLALGRCILAEVALAQRKWEDAEKDVTRAIAVLDGGEAPLAEWRVYVTAAHLAEQRRRKAEAWQYWERSTSVLLRLADSLGHEETLRQTFLTQPRVKEILQRG